MHHPRSFVSFVVAVLVSVPAARAQQPAAEPMAALRGQWQTVSANLVAAAEELTEAEYAFRPVATVRTFGEIIGHVAGSQDMFCALALGETPPAEDAVESAVKTKAGLVAALKASNAHCARAYAIAAARLGDAIQMFGASSTKADALALNAVHDGEHYGNVVTYMRMQGKVPPSSKR
ncbi:MAG: DinB family protein [Gemmatimonadales bacterium]